MNIETIGETKEKVKSIKKEKLSIKKPSLYKVILFNDDFTPFNFVIQLLVVIFHKSNEEATKLTMEIHKKGSAVVALYPKDIAISKQLIVQKNAFQYQYPLVCKVEKE